MQAWFNNTAWFDKEMSVRLGFFFSSRRRHTRLVSDWSSDVCSSDLCPRGRLVEGDGAAYEREAQMTLPNRTRRKARNARPRFGFRLLGLLGRSWALTLLLRCRHDTLPLHFPLWPGLARTGTFAAVRAFPSV